MLGPELDEGGIALGLVRAQLLEHRAGEAIEVAERARGGHFDVGQWLPPLARTPLPHELSVLHADLAIGAALLEEGRAEAATRVAQRDLVVRLARRRDHRLRHLV